MLQLPFLFFWLNFLENSVFIMHPPQKLQLHQYYLYYLASKAQQLVGKRRNSSSKVVGIFIFIPNYLKLECCAHWIVTAIEGMSLAWNSNKEDYLKVLHFWKYHVQGNHVIVSSYSRLTYVHYIFGSLLPHRFHKLKVI